MNTNSNIASKMENIKTIFQDARETASKLEDTNGLIICLEKIDAEFRSVAYEGASMGIAQKDFANGATLQLWNTFTNHSLNHAAQIYMGLGWAIAAEKRKDLSFMNTLNLFMHFRIWDGCGYFDGILKQRQTIKSGIRQDYVSEKDFPAYDQGVGRSLWYICKGDETKIPEMINNFSPARHKDLWRGIGIAFAYVGGFNDNVFDSLLPLAGQYRIQLGIGAAMVAKSRIQANCLTTYSEKACNIWCNLTASEARQLTIKAEESSNYTFKAWLSEMEEGIRKSISVL